MLRKTGLISISSPIPSSYSSLSSSWCMQVLSASNSVLCLAATKHRVFAGTQDASVLVWETEDFSIAGTLPHDRTVISMIIMDNNDIIITESNGSIRCWSTTSLQLLHVVPCKDQWMGDVYSLAIISLPNVDEFILCMGCQNMSIQLLQLSNTSIDELDVVPSACSVRYKSTTSLQVGKSDVKSRRVQHHNGYVYCLNSFTPKDKTDALLISGGGDDCIIVWSVVRMEMACNESCYSLKKHSQLLGHKGSVLSLAVVQDRGLLFSSSLDNTIIVWDLETLSLRRKVRLDDGTTVKKLITCGPTGSLLLGGTAGGTLVWNADFQLVEKLSGHENGQVLALAVIPGRDIVVTGGTDDAIRVWDCKKTFAHGGSRCSSCPSCGTSMTSDFRNLEVIKGKSSIPTVSGDPTRQDDCWTGARFLRDLFISIGMDSKLVVGPSGKSPVVLGRVNCEAGLAAPTITIYGHYDVVGVLTTKPSQGRQLWDTPPFELHGRDGFLYGRGVTDDKGPIVATIFAVHELLISGKLNINVRFIYEGEEENGSEGFNNAIEANMSWFSGTECVLISNTYWLGDDLPCLVYGLRGVLHIEVEVAGATNDLHSGVDGGAMREPMQDLIKLLAALTDNNGRVLIPGFYDDVLKLTRAEALLYDGLSASTARYKPTMVGDIDINDSTAMRDLLMRRWREPTLTVHDINVSGPGSKTVIPCRAKADISMRLVANQDINNIKNIVETYLRNTFESLGAIGNTLIIRAGSAGEPWMGDINSPCFKAAEAAVEKVWGVPPLLIREGGGIPTTPYICRALKAKAIHLPLGAASDHAHLPNERTPLKNLLKGKDVIRELLNELGRK